MNKSKFVWIGRRLQNVIAIMMSLILTLSFSSAALARSDEPVTIEVGSGSGMVGDTVSIAVYMNPGDHAFWSYEMNVAYDPGVLELVEGSSVTDEASSDSFDTDATIIGKLQVTAQIFSFVETKQKMFTMQYKIKSVAAIGNSSVTIQSGTFTEDTTPALVINTIPGVVSVTATPTVTVGSGSVSGKAGQSVEVPVSVTAITGSGIASYGIQIDFDSTALEVTQIVGESGDYFLSVLNSGWLKVAWVDALGGDHVLEAGDNLFTITFQIKTNATLGEKPLTVNPIDVDHYTITDASTTEMNKTWTVGRVTVVGDSTNDNNNSNNSNSNNSNNSNSSTTTQPTMPTILESTSTGVDVLVNGKIENAGTAITSRMNGQSVTTIMIDQKKLEDKLAAEGNGAVVTIPVNTKSDVVVAELNGQMVKNMESKQAILELKTDKATYTLPAQLINIDSISNQLGKSVALEDIKIYIEISVPTVDTVKIVENAAEKGMFTLVVPPMNFTIKGTFGGTTIDVSKFNAYVERTLAIPDGVDPNRITTGVVVDQDGMVRHVPTKIVFIEGKYYAVINSLTNSTYSVVWHPLEFSDVANHWAKEAVNDIGSRMVINGTGNEMFSPDRDITRAEFAAIMVRGLGLKLESSTSIFTDVKEIDWYSSAIHTAYTYEVINGFEDSTFKPNEKITREQAMLIISKAMVITNLQGAMNNQAVDDILKNFTDASNVSSWAKSGIADSVQSGIIHGRSNDVLAPKAFITRAEVAVMVQRLLQKSNLINTNSE